MRNITLKVMGMMCEGCENRVKNALKTIEGIEEVQANHVTGVVEVTANDSIMDDIIMETIEDIGYEVQK